jgi:hypothetical protein
VSRFDSSSQQALSERDIFAFRQLVDVGVTSGTIYACSGYRYLYAMGNTYTPVGVLGGIEPIQEESDPFPRGLKLWLAAVSSAQFYHVMQEDMFARGVNYYEVFLDPLTFEMSNTPELRWTGKTNEVELRFRDAERGPHTEIIAETELRRIPKRIYFNQETLWQTYSGDSFYKFQHAIPLSKSTWGGEATRYIGNQLITAPKIHPRLRGRMVY